jgi:outer membrane protein TolC
VAASELDVAHAVAAGKHAAASVDPVQRNRSPADLPAPSRALPLLTSLLLGCTAYPQRPAPPVFPADAAFSRTLVADAAVAAAAPGDWWHVAVAPATAAALDAALARNPTLEQASAEAEAARARLDQARAEAGAALDLRAEAAVQKVSGSDAVDSRAAALGGSVPLDLNGALAQRVEAARLAAEAAAAERAQSRSDLARDYLLALLDAAEAAERGQLLERQIEIAQELLRLIELRFTQGLASGVDVLQQRDQVAALRQQLPGASLARRRAENRLRLLGAQHPAQALAAQTDALPPIAEALPEFTPLELLQRRAGLRAQQARLAAADARFAQALAERWPSLSLSADLAQRVVSGDVSTLVSAALGAAFTLFDGGAKAAIAAERRAELAAAGAGYLGAWLEAVIELDDLRHALAELRLRIDLSQQRLETAQATLEAAQRRYLRGVSDYLPALAALRDLQQQQRDHLALRAELARTLVRLHHAGGESLPEEAA